MVDEISAKLAEVGLTTVSVEPDRAIVVFRDDLDLREFRRALTSYRQGPRINPKTAKPFASTKWDLFEYIDAASVRIWGREDRTGSRLNNVLQKGVEQDRIYKLDVELWHPGTRRTAEQLVAEVTRLLDPALGERMLDQFIGQDICILRIGILGRHVDSLLEISGVAEVELPPVTTFDPVHARHATADQFPKPARPDDDGPRVCVLDSGVSSNHPLLRAHIGHTAAILTETNDPADQHGHGTMVVGLAVFGDVKECYDRGSFESPITVFSGRVLNDNLHFDDDRLIISQIRSAVEAFYGAPYNCRVFNLSLGSGLPAFGDRGERQPLWAEALDILARELKVLCIVSAGNNGLVFTNNADAAENVLRAYPNFLFEPSGRLDDPATSAISITVGSLAQTDLPAVMPGPRQDDIARPVARSDCPSPFTRTGPGICRGLKPEFVDYGGNLTFLGVGQARRIAKEPATSAMSLSHDPLRTLFAYDVGTSFSAPRVARKAAIAWHVLHGSLHREPHPNLIRALLAVSASVPTNAREMLELMPEAEDKIARTCGYGLIDLDFVMDSADRRVCLVAQGILQVDHFTVYEVPVPPEFCSAPGYKTIDVALAFDPPVRRRRADYLGVEMSYRLIRGLPLERVVDAYRQLGPDEEPERTIRGRFLVDLQPVENSRSTLATRKKSTLQKASCRFQRLQDYGETYYLVVRAEGKWAPRDERQHFGVVVSMAAEDPRLYHLLRERVRPAVRIRARG